MRLFLAIKPDRATEGRLAQRVLEVQQTLDALASSLRWTPATNIHATLHFLGEVAPARVAPLRRVLEPPLQEPAFDIELGGLGAFPPAGAPRVVWLDITKGDEALARVYEELSGRLRDAGFTIEPRPFSPHLTIARVPDRERSRVKSLRERLAQVPPSAIPWRAERVTLFRSDLSGSVPRYEVIQETSLAQ